jgi:3-oxoacyl-[acyl-carrier-protein] synthase III
MFLLGIGSALPNVIVHDSDLAAFGTSVDAAQNAFLRRAGIRSRAVSLPLEFSKGASGDWSLFDAWKAASHSPTSLALEAVRKALESSGIGIESVGLVLADTATPYQRCPSEAQRIAGEFGVKVPAYDTTGGVGAIPNFLATLAAWKPERVPEYVLCVSTNTPSQHVAYRKDGLASRLFGDAAVALILSASHSRGFSVSYANLVAEPRFRAPFVVEQSISCVVDRLVSSEELEVFIKAELDILRARDAKLLSSAFVIPPQLYSDEAKDILVRCGLSAEQVVTAAQEVGFSLGSAFGVAMDRQWGAAIQQKRSMVLLHCGDGLRGSVVLERCFD